MSIKNRKKSIGVFDSGFGGIHVFRSIVETLPQYDFHYLGDTARTPYGTRSKDVVIDFTCQAVDFLFSKGSDLVVLACFTASTIALRHIQQVVLPQKYPDNKRVLGVFVPIVEEALDRSRSKRVGVIATDGTVRSDSFSREIKLRDPDFQVFQQSCPLLVPLVEAGEENSTATDYFLDKYLEPLLAQNIDTLILGCTHYGILSKLIEKKVGPSITILSNGSIVSQKLTQYLQKHSHLEKELSTQSTVTFYSTDLTERFSTLGGRFFGKKIDVDQAILL